MLARLSRRFQTAHRWFVCITVETEDTEAVDNSTHPVIGIDVGINTVATLSDGTKYDNPRPLKRYERKLKREQRKLSRRVFKSKNWFKLKAKIAEHTIASSETMQSTEVVSR